MSLLKGRKGKVAAIEELWQTHKYIKKPFKERASL